MTASYSSESLSSHPLQVAYILAEMEMDTTTIAAGMLHDTVEDTSFTHDKNLKTLVKKLQTSWMVLQKLYKIPYTNKQEIQAENLRKCSRPCRKIYGLLL